MCIRDRWYDEECQDAIEAKRNSRLKCIQRNTRANKEEYNRIRIEVAIVCRRKKREALKKVIEEIVEQSRSWRRQISMIRH